MHPTVDGTLLPAMIGQIFVDNRDFIHRHLTPPLILIVLSRLDRDTISDGDVALEKGRGCCT